MATKAEVQARYGIVAVSKPQDVSATELPSETMAMEGEAVASEVSAPLPEPRLAPHIILQNAVHNLDVARWEARQCRAATVASREAFNVALNAWNRTMPIQTVDEAKRDVIRTNQIEREKRAAQGLLRRPMTVTETARAMSGGNRRAGGGAAYKRSGTFTRAEAAKVTMNRAAANRLRAAAKLPSDR